MRHVFKSPFAVYLAIGLAVVGVGGLARISLRHASSPPVATVALANKVVPATTGTPFAADPVVSDLLAVATGDTLIALARDRVAASLKDAFVWAQAPVDLSERERRLSAVVQAWAETDPIAAVRWARAQTHDGNEQLMEAALAGAARRPALAAEIGRLLLAADSETGAAHGTMFVGALTGAGEFEAAFQFARTAPAELRDDWLAAAFHRWAAQKPEAAVRALDSLDAPSRLALFRSLADGWAERDPAGLTAYTSAQPPSPERDQVLAAAMFKWGEQDPTALAAWLNTLPRGLEFDVGAAVLVMRTDQANRSVDVALHWVESIATKDLRRDSLQQVLVEWEQNDPASARAYLERVEWLTPEERAAIRAQVEQLVRSRREA